MGLTALSKIQARAFTEDSREDILLNAVSEFVRLLIFHNMISKQIGKVPLGEEFWVSHILLIFCINILQSKNK